MVRGVILKCRDAATERRDWTEAELAKGIPLNEAQHTAHLAVADNMLDRIRLIDALFPELKP